MFYVKFATLRDQLCITFYFSIYFFKKSLYNINRSREKFYIHACYVKYS